MEFYLEALKNILANGRNTCDINDQYVKSIPGFSYTINLEMGDDGIIGNFPLSTTKKVSLRIAFEELMFKLRGETNIRGLIGKGVRIWSDQPFIKWLNVTGEADKFQWYINKEKTDYTFEWKKRRREFEDLILGDVEFAKKWGELDPKIGQRQKSIANAKRPIDQLMDIARNIRKNPDKVLETVAVCNPSNDPYTLSSPCTCFYQFVMDQNKTLHMKAYQGECEAIVGIPYNYAQDSLLIAMMTTVTGLKIGKITHVFGGVYIYENHRKHVEFQIAKEPRPLPGIRINPRINDLTKISYGDIELIGYNPHEINHAPVAI